MEQGKENLNLEKVNHVLSMFGHSLAPEAIKDIEKNQDYAMRTAVVFYQEIKAGILTETNEWNFIFKYDEQYIIEYLKQFLTITMPVNKYPYHDKHLFSFFEGLIPEGRLLEVTKTHYKINPNDRMDLFLACCQNCIGAVSVKPLSTLNE